MSAAHQPESVRPSSSTRRLGLPFPDLSITIGLSHVVMRIKLHHSVIKILGVIGSAILLGGALLDTVSNSLSLISKPTTYILTVILVVAAGAAHLWLKKRPLTIVKNDEGEFKLYRGLDLTILASLVGVIVILWIPRLFDKGPNSVENPTRPAPEVVVTPVQGLTLTYSLTVQPRVKDQQTNNYKPSGEPYESTGQEIYGNGWDFRVNITPTQGGSLYLLNEGAGVGGALVYNVLFPTRANNDRVAQIEANQTIRTGKYFFDEYAGTEKLWIIWSAKPLERLDNIFKDADETGLVITDQRQIDSVREILARYYLSKPEVMTDKAKRQTVIKGQGDILISLLELQHE